ncbi:MAG TPA: hypothetical protein QGF08_03170 [Candidatus Marinimicrobia bacterium]|nr:hypothetical protein [Candidatus Neomarinimicrobiota bacterium]HJL73829.1 hypothetical protein [Candidatus Neomarinimicrobiota bacterium]HJM69865.1 hypothetical protein [Candidatus Neomarinimicrobiota bacterium]
MEHKSICIVIFCMEIILGIFVIAIAIMAMSVGIKFNNKPLQGTCGGQNNKIIVDGIEITYPTCGGDTKKCENTEVDFSTV